MFNEYEQFLNAKNDKSHLTLRSYRRVIDAFLSALNINSIEDLKAVTAIQFREYRNSLKITNSSKNTMTRIISSFFSWLYQQEYIQSNIFDKIEYLSTAKKMIRMPTELEMQNILEKSKGNKKLFLMVNILGRIGLRSSEMANIKLSDISDGRLLVHGKGNKERSIKLPQDILDMIADVSKMRHEKSEYLFSWGGHAISGTAVYLRINRFVKSTGFTADQIARFGHGHAFRHYTLTGIYEKTKDPYAVKFIAGHSNLAIGEKYIHARNEVYDYLTAEGK
jgi:site-specific recombinase XerD